MKSRNLILLGTTKKRIKKIKADTKNYPGRTPHPLQYSSTASKLPSLHTAPSKKSVYTCKKVSLLIYTSPYIRRKK